LPELLQIMVNFNMILQIEPDKVGEPLYVAPQYLPESPPAMLDFLEGIMKYAPYRIYYPGYIHRSIVQECFAHYHNDILRGGSGHLDYAWWRNGLVVKKDNRTALIKFEEQGQYVSMFSQDADPRCPLLGEILQFFRHVNKNRNAFTEVTVDGKHYIQLLKLNDYADHHLNNFMIANTTYQLRDFSNFLKDREKSFKKVFISYSSVDKTLVDEVRSALLPYELNQQIQIWYDRMIPEGRDWDRTIRHELSKSDIVLFLLSPDFLKSDYINDVEIKEAIRLEKEGELSKQKDSLKIEFLKLYDLSYEIIPWLSARHTEALKHEALFLDNKGERMQRIKLEVARIFSKV
jgi:hypothetical protein